MAEGAVMGKANVPVGSVGRAVGKLVSGVASKVVVMVVTTTLCLLNTVS